MAKEKQLKVRVDAPASGYRHYLYANRFAVQKVDEYLLISFGLIHNRVPLAELSALISIEEFQRNRESNLGYVDQIIDQGGKAEELIPWGPSLSNRDVPAINVLSLTRSNDVAESLLLNISNRYVWEVSQRNTGAILPVTPDAFALIRSKVSLQISMLLEVYKMLPPLKG
jgi:hypothetical protein